MPLPRIERKEKRALSPGEVAELADTIGARWRAFVLVGAYCGLRPGELVALRSNSVDLLHRRLRVIETASEVSGRIIIGPPKTHAGRRSVPISVTVASELRAHLERLAVASDGLVFPAPEGGMLRLGLFRRRVWYPAVARAGIDPPITPHELRHTAITLWARAGSTRRPSRPERATRRR